MAVLEPIFVVMVEGLFGKNYLCALAWSGPGWLVGPVEEAACFDPGPLKKPRKNSSSALLHLHTHYSHTIQVVPQILLWALWLLHMAHQSQYRILFKNQYLLM